MIDHLEKLIKKFDGQISLTTSGNGDPFASDIYQNFLKNINLKPGQIINFLTHGLLLKTRCEANPNLIETTQNFFISSIILPYYKYRLYNFLHANIFNVFVIK